jgi:murein DD-endopeptidase MepM/ murein hydrolase activator NlpD
LTEELYQPRPVYAFWGPRTTTAELSVAVGREIVPGLTAGPATVRVTAHRAGTLLRRPPPVVAEVTLPVRLDPPQLSLLSTQHYVSQGGVEAVVYRVGEAVMADGVEAGPWFFPGHPLPGGATGERFALWAAPYDLEDAGAIRLRAEDDAGNVARLPFVDRFTPRPYSRGTIQLPAAFLERVVPEIRSQTPDLPDQGDLLANYLQINGALREKNADRLVQLAGDSAGEFLWDRPFLPLPNGQVMSPFAEERTYLHQGQAVDRQFHLGFDLASVQRAEVPAAAAGVVVLAEYFGIYGNAVVLDHGFGLMSLYGHLSSIEVARGQRVSRGQALGRSGQTGLAGGDHLHFAVLLQGLPVNPIEWWDGHFLRDRLSRKLGAALPLQEG